MLTPFREKQWRKLEKELPRIVIDLNGMDDATFELKELFSELDRLREELENQNGYTLGIIDSCDKAKGLFISEKKEILAELDRVRDDNLSRCKEFAHNYHVITQENHVLMAERDQLREKLDVAVESLYKACAIIVNNPKGSYRGEHAGSISAECYSFLRGALAKIRGEKC